MSFILSIETTTKTCSVALHQNDAVVGLQELHLEKSHSSLLHVLIANLLTHCDVKKAELLAIAVSEGPGSYTGLRIGTATAKGLCYALDIPLIGVSTLGAMAWGVRKFNVSGAFLCPMIDARRMEVYCQVFDHKFSELTPVRPVVVNPDSFNEFLDQQPVLFFGDGAQKCIDLLGKHRNAKFVPQVLPSAQWVGELAGKHYASQKFEALVSFEPFYLKEFRTTQPKSR